MAVLVEGRIVKEGSPLQLVEELQNQIWSKTISREALSSYKTTHRVISTRLVSGKTQLRVLSSSKPAEGFVQVNPGLEDVYFTSVLNTVNL
jgi:hypothetical protein